MKTCLIKFALTYDHLDRPFPEPHPTPTQGADKTRAIHSEQEEKLISILTTVS